MEGIYSHMVWKVPSASSLSYLWNFGSFLLISMFLQVFSGILLSMFYTNEISQSFQMINFITNSVNSGFYLRIIHLNGSSLFFLLLYLHIFRGLYYGSFKNMDVWNSGMALFIISMLISFMGYVLPWGQMSFWAATVITKFVSAVPIVGEKILQWVWGGYSVGIYTLKFFFTLHFLLPLFLLLMIFIHLSCLHFMGSSNKSAFFFSNDKMKFGSYYLVKDSLNLPCMLILFTLMSDLWMSSEMENFKKANYMLAPAHITPEWYFLFSYAILRSVPNKFGGVMVMGMSIMILVLMCLISKKYSYVNIGLFSFFFLNFIMLSWIGSEEANDLMSGIGMIFTIVYFSCFVTYFMKTSVVNKLF